MRWKDDRTLEEVWDSSILDELFSSVFSKDKAERAKRKNNEWVMLLDELDDDQNTTTGMFKSTTYGYKNILLHGIDLTEPEDPRDENQGEQIRTHFLVRKMDGLLLLEVSTNGVTRSKLEDYLNDHGNEVIDRNNIYSIRVSSLISTEFIEEISKFNRIKEAHLEIKTKDASGLSAPYQALLDETNELKGNAVRLIVKAVYDKDGLMNVVPWVNKVKQMSGVKSIKIKGTVGGADKFIDVDKNAEKYTYSNIRINENRIINSYDLYDKMEETSKIRELIR